MDVTDEWLDMVCAELQPWATPAVRSGAAELVTGAPADWVDALRRAADRTPSKNWDWYEPVIEQVVAMPDGQEAVATAVRDDDVMLEFAVSTLGSVWCIEALGTAEVGRRYQEDMRSDTVGTWVIQAVWFGFDGGMNPLPVELRWRLVMAALDACPDDDGELSMIGDGPCDTLAIEPGMHERFYRQRESNPKVRRLFEAMRRELTLEGHTNAWWFPEVEAQIRREG